MCRRPCPVTWARTHGAGSAVASPSCVTGGDPALASTDQVPGAGWRRPIYVALCDGTVSAITWVEAAADPAGTGVIRPPWGDTSVTSGGPPLPVSRRLSTEVPARTVNFPACALPAWPGGAIVYGVRSQDPSISFASVIGSPQW